jgi:peptidoglycan/xylan/chitin deacetylase (PgdA/CDA1 family)
MKIIKPRISLTFDDAPTESSMYLTGEQRTNKIIKTLNDYSVQAAFFVNSSSLKSQSNRERVKKYNDTGHLIANHGYSHLSLDQTDVDKYIFDIIQAHRSLKQFSNFRPWFRFPYLAHGDTYKKRDKVRKFLKNMGYRNGYVSVFTEDWFIQTIFEEHQKNGGLIDHTIFSSVYSAIIWDNINFHDNIALTNLGFSPVHTLLLHENDIAALFLDNLIETIYKQGWEIVSPEIAFQDSFYLKEPMTLFENRGNINSLIYDKLKVKHIDPWSETTGQKIKKEFIVKKALI